MCSTSVDPMPSRISRPNRSRNRAKTDGGRDSPADIAQRMLDEIEFAPLTSAPPDPGVRQQHRVMRRDREEQSGTIAFDQAVCDRCGHRTRPENAGRANGERKVHRVAKAIREEQLGDAEAPVRRVDAEHATRIRICAHDHVVLQMHARFRTPGAAGRIQPERWSVANSYLRRRADAAVASISRSKFRTRSSSGPPPQSRAGPRAQRGSTSAIFG